MSAPADAPQSTVANARPAAASRADFVHFHTITTRVHDNDIYGHVNNIIYYAYFDTAVNEHLIAKGALSMTKSDVIGLVVETQCRYFRSVSFPDTVHVGVRVASIGSSSVRYELAIFNNDNDDACAQGHFVHVYVDRHTNRPLPIPAAHRAVMEALQIKKAIEE